MSRDLVEQYRRQDGWRRWDEALSVLPLERGQRVLDVGCGTGQVAARLSRLGADVVGIDSNEALLAAARASHPEVRFARCDLTKLTPQQFGLVDGLWASFVTAYFPDLTPLVRRLGHCLRPGGWMAMVEIDDLLGHEPIAAEFRSATQAFYEEARAAGRYDFESGRRLADAARAAGLTVVHEGVLADDELSFAGAAAVDVLEAWGDRLGRMGGLKAFLGDRFEAFERAFLAALGEPSHASSARVIIVVARSAEGP